jgi:hypothetical protein
MAGQLENDAVGFGVETEHPMTAKQNAWMVAGIACLFVAAIATTATAQQRNGQNSQTSADLAPLASLQDSSYSDTAMSAMSRPAPAPEAPCPWDCQAVPNGDVGIEDFLLLLGAWGTIGTSCDFGNGPVGVGIEDFLNLLANWGPCP